MGSRGQGRRWRGGGEGERVGLGWMKGREGEKDLLGDRERQKGGERERWDWDGLGRRGRAERKLAECIELGSRRICPEVASSSAWPTEGGQTDAENV